MSQFSVTNTTLQIPTQLRAKAINSNEAIVEKSKNYLQTPKIAYNAVMRHRGNDHDLAVLDDAVKKLSVLGIATIASWSYKSMGSTTIPIWLGAAGWLAAMQIVPEVMNRLTQMQTGIPLFYPYRSSQNDVRNLLDNPDYMPTQILPKDLQNKLCKRFDIPLNSPNRQEKLEAKLKQVSVQAHTWWMLIAGPATPLLSSIVCDTLETPIEELSIKWRMKRLREEVLAQAIKKKSKPAIEAAIKQIVETVVDKPQGLSVVGLWWQKLPGGILKTLGLDSMEVLKALETNSPIEDRRFNRLTTYVTNRLRSLKVREELESYLLKRSHELNQAIEPTLKLLRSNDARQAVSRPERLRMIQQVRLARGRGQGTISHFLSLLGIFEKYEHSGAKVLYTNVQQHMEKPNIGYIEHLVRQGRLGRMKELSGRYTTMLLELIESNRFVPAQNLIGESPRDLLLRASRSLSQRKNWLRWFPWTVGSTLGIGTLLFMFFALGENYPISRKPKASENRGGL